MASLRAWPALEEVELDGWRLRFSEGFTGRANSVQSLRGSARPLADRVGECERWYAERGRPTLFRITPFSEPGLEECLAELGYASFNPTDVMCTDGLELASEVQLGRLSDAPLHEWLETYARLSGLAEANATMGRILTSIGPPSLLGVLRSGGREVACGLGVADGDYLGLFDLVVHPDLRRRGYGGDLVRQLCAWGRTCGAGRAYLQVTRDNTVARALYAKLGFGRGYEYHYRVQPS